ncbi:MAG: glycosyltransferase family 4 protein [Chloroflexi bacterium]|nr:glycosyltransferase family 4 protein [Chloroflexota bacterium]
MRICVVSGTFHPEPGGPPTFLFHLLPKLVERSHTVEVITYGEPGSPANYGYPVTRISRRHSIPIRLLNFILAVLRASRRADVFFVSDYGLPVALVNLFLRKPLALKNVGDFAWEFSTRHGWIPAGQTIDDFQTAPHSLRVNLLRAAQRWYTRAALRVIAPSHYSAGLVKGWGINPARVRVIYNALEQAEEPRRETAKQALDVSGPLLVTVARLAPWKGVAEVIRALEIVRRKFPTTQLMVVGDGPQRAALEAQAAPLGEAVQFAGAQPPERVRQYLLAADVFVLFSTYEGLPHTVLEAMQARTPVVVSDAGGNQEVVTRGETGWVVPKGDVQALASTMIDVLSHPEQAAARAAAAFVRLDRFSWSRLVDEYESTLLGVLEP